MSAVRASSRRPSLSSPTISRRVAIRLGALCSLSCSSGKNARGDSRASRLVEPGIHRQVNGLLTAAVRTRAEAAIRASVLRHVRNAVLNQLAELHAVGAQAPDDSVPV